jgi:hypothetical protein
MSSKLRVKDIWGNVGEWSDALEVTVSSGSGGGSSYTLHAQPDMPFELFKNQLEHPTSPTMSPPVSTG